MKQQKTTMKIKTIEEAFNREIKALEGQIVRLEIENKDSVGVLIMKAKLSQTRILKRFVLTY